MCTRDSHVFYSDGYMASTKMGIPYKTRKVAFSHVPRNKKRDRENTLKKIQALIITDLQARNDDGNHENMDIENSGSSNILPSICHQMTQMSIT